MSFACCWANYSGGKPKTPLKGFRGMKTLQSNSVMFGRYNRGKGFLAKVQKANAVRMSGVMVMANSYWMSQVT